MRPEATNRQDSLHRLSSSVNTKLRNILHQTDNEALPKNPSKYTYDDLLKIENNRRNLLTRVKRFDIENITMSFYGTVFPALLASPSFYITTGLYLVLRVLLQKEVLKVGNEMPQISLSFVSIIAGFVNFFLVFFVSQAYSRFLVQYDNSMKIEGRILNLAFLARCYLPVHEAWRLIRYINAIHVVGYTGLSKIYTEDNLFDAMNEKHKLLTDAETRRIKMIGPGAGGSAYREVLGWCIEIVHHHHQNEKLIDMMTMQMMVGELLTLRGCIGTLFDYEDQPMPFIYVHLLFLMTIFYLPLITYSVAVYIPTGTYEIFADILGYYIVLLNFVFTFGLREIGHAMIDPYADNLQDLSVIHYLEFAIITARRILTGHVLPPEGLFVEEDLEMGRPSRGPGFNDHSMKPVVCSPSMKRVVLSSRNSGVMSQSGSLDVTLTGDEIKEDSSKRDTVDTSEIRIEVPLKDSQVPLNKPPMHGIIKLNVPSKSAPATPGEGHIPEDQRIPHKKVRVNEGSNYVLGDDDPASDKV